MQITDASGQTATKAVTLVIAAAPVVTFAPQPGEVSIGYSQQPLVAGGTGPYAWTINAGSLPAGVTLNATTGLVSGTPTAAGSATVTIAVTDAFAQTSSATVPIVIVALPSFGLSLPPGGQVGLAYSTRSPSPVGPSR